MRYFKSVDLENYIAVCGVACRMTNLVAKDESGLWFKQRIVTKSRNIDSGEYAGCYIKAELSFDDECGNRHNTFAITGSINKHPGFSERGVVACGCLHDEIAEHFPELAHLIKWHNVSTDSPMHYVANTVYHASDRDYRGKRKGEPTTFAEVIKFNGFPITFAPSSSLLDFLRWFEGKEIPSSELGIVAVQHKEKGKPGQYQFADKFTFAGAKFADSWTYAPFDTLRQAEQWKEAIQNGYSIETFATAFSEGKERDFDAARACGVWPDATDEQLSADPEELTAALNARLPELMARFKSDITGAGFYWSPEEME